MSAFAQTEAPLLEMRGVTKPSAARRRCAASISTGRGEIHALLGENGAGKSTLMKCFPASRPDGGEMRLDGHPVRFADPRAAQAAGVATIFQELDLVPTSTSPPTCSSAANSPGRGVLDRARCAAPRASGWPRSAWSSTSTGRSATLVGAARSSHRKALTYASRI